MTSSSNVLFPRELKKQIEIQMSGTLYGIMWTNSSPHYFIKLGDWGTDRLLLASEARLIKYSSGRRI